jgi:HSP20 family protein
MPGTTISRWDPFNEAPSLRTAMDRFFDPSFFRFPGLRGTGSEELGTSPLGLDIYETNDELVVKAAIPGVDPKNVDISVEEDVLTIKGSFESREEVKDEHYHRRELRSGEFHRSLRLPPTVEPANATATFENGLLKLSLPKKQEAKSRSIKITPQGVIEQPQDGATPAQG